MVEMGCCSGFCSSTADQFTDRIAARDLAGYRRKGPPVTTRLLCEGLRAAGATAGTLLDIGSGIGALTFELIDMGLQRAVAVDASEAYIAAGREEARRRGHVDTIEWRFGDFVSHASEFQQATIVTLDRVVCCYPYYKPLLMEAASRAKLWLALAYPRDRWYVRALIGFDNAKRRLRSNWFRSFVHPTTQIGELIRGTGFRLVRHTETVVWRIEVYARTEPDSLPG